MFIASSISSAAYLSVVNVELIVQENKSCEGEG